MKTSTKINTLSSLHAGTQPVRVLQFNITKQFETTNPVFIELTRQIITKNGLQAGISYYINEEPILCKVDGHVQTPFVNGSKKIALHETFLSYVWAVSYSFMVLYEEAVVKPSQNHFFQEQRHKIDVEKIANTEELFRYGISLIKVFSEWDKEKLPNPELFDSADRFYVERANAIFVKAINFILCHEFAHVEKGHHEKIKAGASSNSDILSFEKEADQRAIELMLSGATRETSSTINCSILIGLCCLLFFRRETTSNTHPHTDDRIHIFIEQINPDASNEMWGLATLAYKLWDNQFMKNFQWPKQVNDLKEMYYHIKQQVEAEKK